MPHRRPPRNLIQPGSWKIGRKEAARIPPVLQTGVRHPVVWRWEESEIAEVFLALHPRARAERTGTLSFLGRNCPLLRDFGRVDHQRLPENETLGREPFVGPGHSRGLRINAINRIDEMGHEVTVAGDLAFVVVDLQRVVLDVARAAPPRTTGTSATRLLAGPCSGHSRLGRCCAARRHTLTLSISAVGCLRETPMPAARLSGKPAS